MTISKKINGTRLIIMALFSVTAALLWTSCTENDKPGKETNAGSGKQKPTYKTAPVQYINPSYQISVPAELVPYEQVSIFAKVPGFVKQLFVDRGDRVRKGQVLAILEAPEMQQRYLSDKSTELKLYNDYQLAVQEHQRLSQASATTGAVADIELDRAKSAMESAKAAYESSQAGTGQASKLQEYLTITAPFDGTVTERGVSVGALVGTSGANPLFMMAEGRRLRLTVSLPEKHAASVRIGMPAIFTISSQPGQQFDTKLSRTSGLLNQQDRSLKLEFDVDNAAAQLQGGDYAQVKLQLQRKSQSYWVASKSIVNAQSGTFVLTLNNNSIRRVAIKEGIGLDSLTEVYGDLSVNDNVLLAPSEEIKEGTIN